MDPVIHAQMTMLVADEKKCKEELRSLRDRELPLWRSRIDLAREKGMAELADQAEARYEELRQKALELGEELKGIEGAKKRLRFESRRPSGVEVQRAEAMVESVRLGGLIDPDEAQLERELAGLRAESEVELDFSDE